MSISIIFNVEPPNVVLKQSSIFPEARLAGMTILLVVLSVGNRFVGRVFIHIFVKVWQLTRLQI